jgi:flagellar basal-body rod modification protein FlgD
MNALVGIRAAYPLGGSNIESAKRAETTAKTTDATSTSAKVATTKAATTAKAADTTSTSTATSAVSEELDRDAFLQLLVTQMQNQDPLSPTDNSEMIAELAQFSSLEQMNNLNESFTSLSTDIDRLNFISAGSLLGRTVSGTDVNGTLQEGAVDQIYVDTAGGTGVYVVVNGQAVSLTNVQQIEKTATASTDTAKK